MSLTCYPNCRPACREVIQQPAVQLDVYRQPLHATRRTNKSQRVSLHILVLFLREPYVWRAHVRNPNFWRLISDCQFFVQVSMLILFYYKLGAYKRNS